MLDVIIMNVETNVNAGKDMISNVKIESARNISPLDKEKLLDEVIKVERSAWPPELQATKEKFASRLHIFPDGFFVARVSGKIQGVTTSQIVTYDPNASKTWDEITDRGMIAKTHDPKGDALYVVSVGVAKDAQGNHVGSKIVEAQKELVSNLGLKYLYLGARIPGYNNYCKEHGEINIGDYLKLKDSDGEALDPEIRFYNRCGLEVKKIISEFEPDVDSRNYGIVMVWENPQKP